MITALLGGIVALVVKALNGLIKALADVLATLFSALPDMPALPAPPAALVSAEHWVAWFFPVATVVSVLTWTLVVFLLWQVVALALRWAKAIGD